VPPSAVGVARVGVVRVVVVMVVVDVLAVVPPTENETDNEPVLPIQSCDTNVAVCEPDDVAHDSYS
jgi:hypothetical protein